MASFSQRKGIRPIRKAIQREEVDVELRNRLWNAMQVCVWDKFSPPSFGTSNYNTNQVWALCQLIWHVYFKLPLDSLPTFDRSYSQSSYRVFRDHFITGHWWEVFDFIEFVAANCDDDWSADLHRMANQILEDENSAYRFVGDQVCDISDEHEIGAIETALGGPFDSARQHLERSLELISSKQNPDYRNAVKEAISAVEAACQEFTGEPKATLGDCLKKIEKAGKCHPALKNGMSSLYGYTSDSGGIRHALSEQDVPPTYSEAKFMLVVCSAFVNLLAGKLAKAK